MTQINICIKHNGVRHIGGVHMAEIDFSFDKPDTNANMKNIVRAEDQIIAERSKRGLIPLTEGDMDKMAEYLINMLDSGYPFYKPHIMIDFDGRRLLANERQTSHLRSGGYNDVAGPFEYQSVDQKTLDEAILIPDKKEYSK